MFGMLTGSQLDSANRWSVPGIDRFGDRFNQMVQAGGVRSQFWADPLLADIDAVHAAITDNGAVQVIATGIAQPDFPRVISATAGGTAGDIKAIAPTITGTDIEDNVITETLPVFTVDTAGTKIGAKAFKTVTSISLPAHDGTGATTSIGFGDALGLDRILPRGNTTLFATVDGVKEATAPTITTDDDEISKNTMDPNTALNGARDFELFWIDTYLPR